jgi:transcription elongation factor Elf1
MMSDKVKPIIKGLDENIKIWLGKRLEDIDKPILFKCPVCGWCGVLLEDPADLEYGSFHGIGECGDCGADFEDNKFKVEAFVKISIVEE